MAPASLVVPAFANAFSPSLVYNTTNAWLFWTQLDDDPATNPNAALKVMEWDGAVWSAPEQLSPEGAAVSSATSTLLTNGIPMVLWWQDSQLLYALGPDFATQHIARTDSEDLIGQNLTLTCNPTDGNVTLVFPKSGENAISLAYRVFDHQTAIWGGDFDFISSNTIDHAISPHYIDDQLIAAFARQHTVYSNKTIHVAGTNMVIKVPSPGHTDLIVARFELDYDLAALDIRHSDTFPPVLYIDVMNNGDLLITNFVVAVRQDSESGPLIGRITNDAPFAPQTTITLDMPWDGIGTAQPVNIIAIVDPDDDIPEFIETNNTVSNRLLQSDIRLESVRYGARQAETFEWIVAVHNPLPRPLTGIDIEIRRDTTNGTLLATGNIATMAPYETIEHTLSVPTAGLAEGATLLTLATAQQQPGDAATARASLRATHYDVARAVPDAIPDFRILRPGLDGSIRLAWTPPGATADGIRVIRQDDAGTPRLIGFSGAGEHLYLDHPEPVIDDLGYQLQAYNADGAGAPTAMLWTNRFIDTSGDGLPDDWQILHFGSPTNELAGFHDDWDGDGVPNWMEYLFGTDPTNSNDFPRVQVTQSESGQIRVQWPGAHLQLYNIQTSTNLVDWITTYTGHIGAKGQNIWIDAPPPEETEPIQFYRIKAW